MNIVWFIFANTISHTLGMLWESPRGSHSKPRSAVTYWSRSEQLESELSICKQQLESANRGYHSAVQRVHELEQELKTTQEALSSCYPSGYPPTNAVHDSSVMSASSASSSVPISDLPVRTVLPKPADLNYWQSRQVHIH